MHDDPSGPIGGVPHGAKQAGLFKAHVQQCGQSLRLCIVTPCKHYQPRYPPRYQLGLNNVLNAILHIAAPSPKQPLYRKLGLLRISKFTVKPGHGQGQRLLHVAFCMKPAVTDTWSSTQPPCPQ